MSKSVEISDEAVAIFQQEVDRGIFPDLASAIAEAARLLAAPETDPEFEASLERAIAEIERGEGIEYTREVHDRIFAEALAEYHASLKTQVC